MELEITNKVLIDIVYTCMNITIDCYIFAENWFTVGFMILWINGNATDDFELIINDVLLQQLNDALLINISKSYNIILNDGNDSTKALSMYDSMIVIQLFNSKFPIKNNPTAQLQFNQYINFRHFQNDLIIIRLLPDLFVQEQRQSLNSRKTLENILIVKEISITLISPSDIPSKTDDNISSAKCIKILFNKQHCDCIIIFLIIAGSHIQKKNINNNGKPTNRNNGHISVNISIEPDHILANWSIVVITSIIDDNNCHIHTFKSDSNIDLFLLLSKIDFINNDLIGMYLNGDYLRFRYEELIDGVVGDYEEVYIPTVFYNVKHFLLVNLTISNIDGECANIINNGSLRTGISADSYKSIIIEDTLNILFYGSNSDRCDTYCSNTYICSDLAVSGTKGYSVHYCACERIETGGSNIVFILRIESGTNGIIGSDDQI